jgi:AraC-like DNA-binding protein
LEPGSTLISFENETSYQARLLHYLLNSFFSQPSLGSGNMDPETKPEADRLSALLLGSLDEDGGTDELARQAYQSRANFYRLFQALVAENPGAMRRRLLLERAAWQLARSNKSVTDIAFDAQYASLEAFSRAFRTGFGISPSLYRRSGSGRFHLPAPNQYHFCPPVSSLKGKSTNMDLFEIFSGTDTWYTRRLLEQASTLNDEQLDRPVNTTAKSFAWDKPDQNLRELLERIVQTKEVWTAALTGGDMPDLDTRPPADRTPEALLARFEKADADFQNILRDVHARGAWDETFVDALCEPAETFTYGGMFADVITFNTHRRLAALDAFYRLGVNMHDSGSPIEYEMAMAGKGKDPSR